MISEFEDAYEDIERVRGAVLETPVSDLMANNPLVVDAESTVVAAVHAMNERHTGCVLVQSAGKLVGIFTERDVLRKVVFREGDRGIKVSSVMTRDPETLPPSASVAYALNKMSVDGYRHIPIIDQTGKAIGVLSVKDIVNFVVEFFPDGVLNLPPDPSKAIPKSADGG
ncbi:MAG: CBS domain-containing protein [Planctomycetes bacterium]|nr:CBS domain-containing protein [Planctomycetota bacterium]